MIGPANAVERHHNGCLLTALTISRVGYRLHPFQIVFLVLRFEEIPSIDSLLSYVFTEH